MATTTKTSNANTTKTLVVLLSLADDTVSVTSSAVTNSKGSKPARTLVLSIPALRKTNKTLYGLLVDDDTIVDGEECNVTLTYEQMVEVAKIAQLTTGDKVLAPVATPVSNGTLTIDPPTPVKTETTVVAPIVVVDNHKANGYSEAQTADTVKRMEVSGVFGSDKPSANNERKVRNIQRVIDRIKGQRLFVVNYYIPKELSQAEYTIDEETGEEVKIHDIRIPSPAQTFYRHGIRLDGSNWFMTEEDLNSEDVQSFFALFAQYADFRGVANKGARGWAVKQDAEESAKLVEWAMEELRYYIVELHTSLINNIATADATLKDAEDKWQKRLVESGKAVTAEEITTATAKRNNRVRSELKSAAEDLNAAICLAERYDATECVEDLFSALRQAIRSNERSFNASVEGQFTLKGRKVKGSDVVV